jgi:ABC-type nitrate/sulfonate/bicarbonate transport system substrate-binding protein
MKQRWLAVVFAWGLVVGIGHAAEVPAKFLLAYGAIGGNAVPLWIAKEQGIFRKYNLDPQLIYIIAGRAMQSMLAGDVQVGLLGATHVTNAVTAGGDMTMLLGLEEKLNFALVVRPGIRTAEELKGKESCDWHAVGLALVGDLCRPRLPGPRAATRRHCAFGNRQLAGTAGRFVCRQY